MLLMLMIHCFHREREKRGGFGKDQRQRDGGKGRDEKDDKFGGKYQQGRAEDKGKPDR